MISQRLSLNMPRLNQNQQIQALTMLARGDNVSVRLSQKHNNSVAPTFPANRWVADRRRPGRMRVTNPRTDRFITLTHLRRRFQTATRSARQYGISKQTVLHRIRQARQPIRPIPMWDKCLQHVIGLPVCSGHNGISVGGDSTELGFYSLMNLGLTIVIMTVEFEFLEEEGIIVSLRGTDLEVGVLW